MEALIFEDRVAKPVHAALAPMTIPAPAPALRRSALDFIWADKTALLVGAGGLAILGYIWGLAVVAAGVSGGNYFMQHEIGLGLECDFAAASSIWFFLRTIDMAAGGPARRARVRNR
jgi:hypothetical protein